MAYQWLLCDRCGLEFSGLDTFTAQGGEPRTAGGYRFYNKDFSPSLWHRFVRGMEEIICNRCMWKDEKYLAQYPHMRKGYIQDLIMAGKINNGR